MSSKWINSLFNSDTSHLTPLDFRLTAAAQFRLLKAMCSLAEEGVDFFQKVTLGGSVASGTTMSRRFLNSQINTLFAKFNASVQASLLSSRAPLFIMVVIMQSLISSAVHTDAFHFSKIGSNQYEIINNFYPLHDNSSYNNVSYFNMLSHCEITLTSIEVYKEIIY